MSNLFSHYRTAGRRDIREFVDELEGILAALNEELLNEGFGEDVGKAFNRATTVKNLSQKQISKILKAASAVSKGEDIGAAVTADKKKLIRQMKGSIEARRDKLQNAEPVAGFDKQMSDIIRKWKEKLGNNHETIRQLRSMGQKALNNPKLTSFVLGVATALTTALATPAFGAAANVALNTATNMIQGGGEGEPA